MDGLQMELPATLKLPDEDLKALIREAQQGDMQARDTLIQGNLRLVLSVIRRFSNRGFETEDLFQIGTIGLVKSIDDFNLEYDVRFSTYAVPKIIGEIKRHIRESAPIHVSRSLKDLATKAIATKDILAAELHRTPTISELSDHLGVMREELVTALDSVAPIQSLHQVIYEQDGDSIELGEQIASVGDATDHVYLKEALQTLDVDERRLVMLRYFAEKSQAEVAASLGISQAQVSRIEQRILQQIRNRL